MRIRSAFLVAFPVAALFGAVFVGGCKPAPQEQKASTPGQSEQQAPSATPAPAAASPAPAAASPAPAAASPAPASNPVDKVVGRWLREDGGYILEIRGGDTGGALQAAYFNPNPITVSRAAWLDSSGLQLLIELTGSGYNGSTYVLRHDPATDRLVGEYRQAVQRQTYQIEFVRQAGR